MHEIVLITGTNLGDKRANLQKAREEIERLIGPVTKLSGIYESAPWGFESDENFLNQAMVCETSLTPGQALGSIHRIEYGMGRVRPEKLIDAGGNREYHSRLIDIDILFYDDIIFKSDDLTIPHPLICEREFVMTPLKEIIGDFFHPVKLKKISDL